MTYLNLFLYLSMCNATLCVDNYYTVGGISFPILVHLYHKFDLEL